MDALVLLRGPLLPEIAVRAGTILHGRVLDAATLSLEGVRLAAKLPEGVTVGEILRLQVQESSPERLHLQVVERPPAEQQQAAQQASAAQLPVAIPLPGGATLTVLPDGGGAAKGGSAGRSAVTVRFDSPALGRLDVRLDGEAAAVHVSAGEPADVVRAALPDLALALGGVAGRPVQVTVRPRARTLDASA